MKKAFDIAIGIFMVILFLAAVIMIATSFKKHHDNDMYLMYGICCIISAFSLYGFSIIVDAAYIYIEKSKKSDE